MKTFLLVALACAIAVLLVAAGCTQTVQPPPTPSPLPTSVLTETPTAVLTPVHNPDSRTDNGRTRYSPPGEHQGHTASLHHLRTDRLCRRNHPGDHVRIQPPL